MFRISTITKLIIDYLQLLLYFGIMNYGRGFDMRKGMKIKNDKQ
ncbi:hypothetical protein N568_0108770 [Lactococcus garvieae TRF1]|uniref:Uncharacterized protein n=1 Tax=Lactococcus garvieae TRF1 TaxID=1380772 RepID=V8AN58_9LACT|nr:hypothetical protein N568_0108770 [Lactococcus garvieae TRF1]